MPINHEEGVKWIKLLDELYPNDTFIITTKVAAKICGKMKDFYTQRTFSLSKSNDAININDDELFHNSFTYYCSSFIRKSKKLALVTLPRSQH